MIMVDTEQRFTPGGVTMVDSGGGRITPPTAVPQGLDVARDPTPAELDAGITLKDYDSRLHCLDDTGKVRLLTNHERGWPNGVRPTAAPDRRSTHLVVLKAMPGEQVKIIGPAFEATVIRAIVTRGGLVSYDVEYWLDGKLTTVTLFDDQLEAVK